MHKTNILEHSTVLATPCGYLLLVKMYHEHLIMKVLYEFLCFFLFFLFKSTGYFYNILSNNELCVQWDFLVNFNTVWTIEYYVVIHLLLTASIQGKILLSQFTLLRTIYIHSIFPSSSKSCFYTILWSCLKYISAKACISL